MIDDNLIQLSFEQLEEIQSRITQVISDKKSARISAAIQDILCIINMHYSDVNIWELLNALITTCQNGDLTEISTNINFDQEFDMNHDSADAKASHNLAVIDPSTTTVENDRLKEQSSPGCTNSEMESDSDMSELLSYSSVEQDTSILIYDPEIFYERLRSIRNQILQHEDSRLLWLTNDGSQKTSKISGRALAELLQETIKKLERLCDTETEMDVSTLNREVLRISDWSEFHLGVSLRKGTLTVITPFSARDLPVRECSPLLTIADMQQQASKGEIHIPFSHQHR